MALKEELDSIYDPDLPWISNYANATALLFQQLKTQQPEINWLEFYFLQHQELVLGPFQGKLACTRIKIGKGVCGTAIQTLQPILVPNVHQFVGHIACDSDSESEVVIPLIQNGQPFGVLDVDCKVLNGFSQPLYQELIELAQIISQWEIPTL